MVLGTPIVLNLIPSGARAVAHVNEIDQGAELQFAIYNGNTAYNVPEGVTATVRGTKGDGFGYTAAAAVTVGSNIITVTLDEQMTAVAGVNNVFELVLANSNGFRAGTSNFILDVECAALNENTVISDSDIAYAEQVLNDLQSVQAVNTQVQQNKAGLAAEIVNRQSADQTLQQNINSEASARQAADNTLQSNINAEASTRATTDASLQSQIDQLIAPSGEAPSAAEVENARIGSDGTVYSTLGDAIRTQNSLVKSHLGDIVSSNVLYERASATVTGTRYAYLDIFTLTNVDITKQYTLHVDSVTGAISPNYTYIRFMDASGNLISQRGSEQTVPVNLTVTPPDGTKSIVIRLYASAADVLPGEAVYSGIKVYEGTTIEYTLNNDLHYQRLDDDEADIETLRYHQSEAGNISYAMASQGIYSALFFVQGSIDSTDHDTDIPMTIRARTAHIPVKNGCKIIADASALSSVYRWYIWKYDTNGDWITTVGMVDITDEYLLNFDGSIRLSIAKRDGSDFTNDDLIALNEHITVLSVSALNILEYGEQLGDIANGADAVPSYWVDNLNADIAKIQMLDAQVGSHGDSFVFITDTHVEANTMVSPVLISSILKKTSVGKVVHGGDIFQSDYTKSGAIAKMYSWFAQMHNANRYYQVRGNHDINDSIDGVSSDEYLNDSEYYGVCVKRSADYIVNPDCNPYYYFDNEVQKIRYFVLDTGSRTTADVTTYFTAQLTWMESLIDALDDTWGIVVLLHIMFTPKLSSDTSALELSDRGTLLKAKLDSLYGRTGKPQIICVVCGHVHRDFSMVSSVGYPIIATACDTGTTIATDYDPVNTDRTPGTTNEQLFDVCHINKATRTINMTRIGAGADRSFTY